MLCGFQKSIRWQPFFFYTLFCNEYSQVKRHWQNFKTGRNLFCPSRQTAHQKQKSAYVFRCSVPTGLSLLSHYIEPKSNLFHLVLTKIIAKRSPTQQLVAFSYYKRYATHLLKNKTAEIPGPCFQSNETFIPGLFNFFKA